MNRPKRTLAILAGGLAAAGILTAPQSSATVIVNQAGSVVSAASGRCLTVEGASTSNGARAIVYDCNGGANQRWTFTSAGEVRVYSGSSVKCLDVYQSGTSAGTRVQTWSCSGNANQKWRFNNNGSLTGTQSGLCLDVTGGGNSPNGTPVQLWTCRSQPADNQFWTHRKGGGLPAGVIFQDTGTIEGWNNYPTSPQKQGVIRNVTSPSYKGGNAIEAQQTYINETGGYHSENVQHHAQLVGQDRYYGQAIYLPPNWQWHNENVTFQQWSPEDPSGPWELMFVQNDEIRLGGSGGISGVIADIASLRGTWIRIVTRIKFAGTDGAFEVWVNGVKRMSHTNRSVLPKTANSVRWSSGIYCTGWRDDAPLGPWQLSIFHDHARIATSYQLAEPANR